MWFLTHSFTQFLYINFYLVRRFPYITLVRDALPVVFGALTFLSLARYQKANDWFNEVVLELRKVTWPGQQEVVRSTIVVLVCIIVCSLILGSFDLLWGKVIGFLLNS